MSKKLVGIYILFSILLFLALAVLFGIRIGAVRKTNVERISSDFETIRQTVETSYRIEDSFDTAKFKSDINRLFDMDKDLNVLVVYSYDTGIEYLRARNSAYLSASASDIAAIKGVPRFTYNSFSQTKITASFSIPHRYSFIVEGVYRIIREDDLIPILRDTILILIVFAIVTAVLILLLRVFEGSPAVAGAGMVQTKEERAVKPPAPEKMKENEPAREPNPNPIPEPAPDRRDEEIPREPCGLFSPETGLGWQAHLEKRLSLELERSAFNEQDLSLVLIRFPKLSRRNNDYKLIAREIQGKVAFEDLAFDYNGDGYAVVLPNSNLDQSIQTITNFQDKLEKHITANYGTPLCGITSRNGRLVDGNRLILEAAKALEKTSPEKNNNIVGFRPDPGKYRQYISGLGVPGKA
jgi:GGDEF domain-containing protein